MSVSLSKCGNVSLSKQAPGLTAIVVGLGWDPRTTTGADFDLDASAIMLDMSGKVLSDSHFVFFNNLKSPDGSVEHTGDNITGEGEGDDEQGEGRMDAHLSAPPSWRGRRGRRPPPPGPGRTRGRTAPPGPTACRSPPGGTPRRRPRGAARPRGRKARRKRARCPSKVRRRSPTAARLLSSEAQYRPCRTTARRMASERRSRGVRPRRTQRAFFKLARLAARPE